MSEPRPLPLDPPCHIQGNTARKLYEELAPELEKLGTVFFMHQPALIIYCESWERERDMAKVVEDEGAILTNGEKGTQYIHPAVNVQKMAQNELERRSKELGMDAKTLNQLALAVPKEIESDDPNNPNSYLD